VRQWNRMFSPVLQSQSRKEPHLLVGAVQFIFSAIKIVQNHMNKIVSTSVVDPKLFVTDPDPTFQRVTDPDPTFKKVPDPVSDPTLNIYFFSRIIILSILKHNYEEYLKFVFYNGKNYEIN
jgi:hypothetical protein